MVAQLGGVSDDLDRPARRARDGFHDGQRRSGSADAAGRAIFRAAARDLSGNHRLRLCALAGRRADSHAPRRRDRRPGRWLPETDPTVAFVKSEPMATGGLSLELSVDRAGRVTGCKLERAYGDERLSNGLCDRVGSRAKLKPAIDEAGMPVPDQLVFVASFNRALSVQSPLVSFMAPSPSPPPPGGQWPPSSDSLEVQVSKLDLLVAGPESAQARAEPWAGVVYAPEHPTRPCRIDRSSGDTKFDARACSAAAKARYDFSRVTNPYGRRMPLHFVLVDGKPRALVPVQKWASRPAPSDTAKATVISGLPALPADDARRLRLNVMVDPSGAVSRCTIATSSGSDAGTSPPVPLCARPGRSSPREISSAARSPRFSTTGTRFRSRRSPRPRPRLQRRSPSSRPCRSRTSRPDLRRADDPS